MEEYSEYKSAEEFGKDGVSVNAVMDSAFIMTAKVAAERFDFSPYPSVYCLFDRFCPSDLRDEVSDNALEWKKLAENLPERFRKKVNRIWNRWAENRARLEKIYKLLPTSVFQADLNATNLLLDTSGGFVGVLDFNLCGSDVFLNYLFREIYAGGDDIVLGRICETLKNVSAYYEFSDIEKEAALPLYRYLKPLWYTRILELKNIGDDPAATDRFLDETEYMQTRHIDFGMYMR